MKAEVAAKDTVKEIAAEIKELLKDAGAAGYSPRQLKDRAKELTLGAAERTEKLQIEMEFEDERDLYRHALGIVDMPAGADRDLEEAA